MLHDYKIKGVQHVRNPNNPTKLSIKKLSLRCWLKRNFNVTPLPILLVLDLYISIKKQPSPLINPANQLESFIFPY